MISETVSETVNDTINGGDEKNDNGNFYKCLPRFVSDQPTEAIGQSLSPIERIVEHDGKQFVLTIVPGQVAINNEDTGSHECVSRLPGDFEQRVEETLRFLADSENINFDQKKHLLVSSFIQLRDVMDWLDEDEGTVGKNDGIKKTNQSRTEITESQIEIALATLSGTCYILKCGQRELYFHSIERWRREEREGETYYQIYFTPVFFSSSLLKQFLWH